MITWWDALRHEIFDRAQHTCRLARRLPLHTRRLAGRLALHNSSIPGVNGLGVSTSKKVQLPNGMFYQNEARMLGGEVKS